MTLHSEQLGTGRPLLLVHGLGGSVRSWDLIAPALSQSRRLVIVDLPGHGKSAALAGRQTIAAFADALCAYIEDEGLAGVDLVGSSVGARLVLELSRRGVGGDCVALDPGGFWRGWETRFFQATISASIRVVRGLQPVMPFVTGNPVTRSLLLAQLSARPWRLPAPGEGQPHPAHDISAAARIGDTLFLGADECADIEILDLDGEHFCAHRRIRLGEAFDLPGGPDEEMDIEGLAVEDGWLWVTGSHSLTRKKPKKSKPLDDHGLHRLAQLRLRPNRMFLGRLPLIETGQGRWDIGLKPLPDGRRPQMLPIGKHGSDLYRALKKHPLLGPFCALPAKENGLDVEGLVVDGRRLGLGLRGPVVGGWALIIEAHIAPASEAPDEANLALTGDLTLHVLDLAGLGIRDLKRRAGDILILAGPTMKLSGPSRVYRWPAWTTPAPADLLHRPEAIIELPHGQGADHPEALAPAHHGGKDALLVVCDSPTPERLAGGAVLADVFGME